MNDLKWSTFRYTVLALLVGIIIMLAKINENVFDGLELLKKLVIGE